MAILGTEIMFVAAIFNLQHHYCNVPSIVPSQLCFMCSLCYWERFFASFASHHGLCVYTSTHICIYVYMYVYMCICRVADSGG